MSKTTKLNSTRGLQVTGGLVTTLLLVAACGSSGGSDNAASGGTSNAGKGTVIETKNGPLGPYLTDGSGFALYMFASDTSQKSSCSGQCLKYWPPVTAKSTPSVAGSATANMLGTISGPNGSKQVTYDGHPLYYFVLDKSAGEIKGQGSTNFGAKWWLLKPDGQSITARAPTTSSYGSSGY